MPTGYTAELCEKDQSFRDFLFTCARAMGACIALRDDPLTAELPDDVGFSDYHTGALKTANDELARLSVMPEVERITFGQDRIKDGIARCVNCIAERKATRARLDAMLANVEAWTPPTADHMGFKDFMREQLESTINFDGDPTYYETELHALESKKPLQVWEEAVAAAMRDIEYHTEKGREDAERNRARNEWVRQLKGSIS